MPSRATSRNGGHIHLLRRKGFSGKVAIDVGAFDGRWAKMHKSVFPDSAVLIVEAQQGMMPAIEATVSQMPGVAFENALLGRESGRPVAFIEMGMGSLVDEEISPYRRSQS